MKVIIQCVKKASVTVNNVLISKINRGYLLLLGIEKDDSEDDINWMANKIYNLRINQDENRKTNLSIKDIDGEILSVSQFTLCAKLDGRRPSFSNAAVPNVAKEMFDKFNATLENLGVDLKKGCFQEHMEVELINDGPFTIICDSKNK